MKKPIVSVSVAVCLVMSLCFYAPASAEQQIKGSYMEAYNMLSALGILQEDEYDFDSFVTRGEFAEYICLIKGIDIIPANQYIFSDVDDQTQYADYIYTAYQLGIMNGFENGEFGHSLRLSTEQAVKALVSCLGYGVKAQVLGGYPTGYYVIANDLKLLNGIDLSEGYIKTGELFILMKNSVNADIYKAVSYGEKIEYQTVKNETVLSEYRNIYKFDGLVTSNMHTGIMGYSKERSGGITVDGFRMINANQQDHELIGRKVTGFYKQIEEGDAQLIYMEESGKSSVFSINARDLENYSGFKFTYYEGRFKQEISIENSINFIYNGVLLLDFTDRHLNPKVGSITFIDNNRDGKYDQNDVLLVTDIRNIVVQGVNIAENEIYDKYDFNNNLKIDVTDGDIYYSIKDKHGHIFGFQELREWDVLSCIISEDGRYNEVVLIDESATGILNEVSEDTETIWVDDTEYKLAKNFTGNLSKESVGSTVTVFWDIENNISAIKPEAAAGEKSLVILTESGVRKKGLSDIYYIKVYSQKKEIETFEIEKKVYYNQKLQDASSVVADLEEYIGTVIAFSLNESNRAQDIITPADVGDRSNRGLYRLNVPGTSLRYGIEAGNFGKSFYRGGIIYTVPTDPELYDDKDNFAVGTSSFTNDQSYLVEGFSTKLDSFKCDVMIYRAQASGGGTVNSSTNLLIESIAEVINSAGEQAYRLKGWSSGKYVEYNTTAKLEYVEENVSVENLRPGDIIRYFLNATGEIDTISLAYNYATGETNYVNMRAGSTFVGYAVVVNSPYLQVSPTIRPEDIKYGDPEQAGQLEVYWIRRSDMITVVETSGDKLTFRSGTLNDIVTYRDTNTPGKYSKVVLLTEWLATVIGVVVYN